MDPCEQFPIRRFEDGQFSAVSDSVIREARVELIVNDDELRLALLCLPRELRELAVGFLRGEGALRRREDLHAVEYAEADSIIRVRGRFDPDALEAIQRRWTLGTGCGSGGTSAPLDRPAFRPVADGPAIRAGALLALTRQFQNEMDLWRRTGGVHACALADADHILLVAEDVGRHNAFDKVVGMAFLRGIDLSDKLMLTTGRLSAEMVSKGIAAGLPLVVGRGAVTALAVELARRFGMTLIGFARAGRFNVYTGYQRVLDDAGPPDAGRLDAGQAHARPD
jgi:FdhD protein